jgi:hypothetical protein
MMRPPVSRGWSAVLRAWFAPFLLLVTPFVIFLQYQRYAIVHADALAAVAVLAAVALLIALSTTLLPAFTVISLAALLTFFADVQLDEPGEKKLFLLFLLLCAVLWLIRRHAASIVSAGVATVLAVSLVQTQSSTVATERWSPDEASADRPLMLHLVLDEHIGVEGLPPDLTPPHFRREIASFYVDRGFRLFGRAYSEYPSTLWSLSHLLNFKPGRFDEGLTRRGEQSDTFRLLHNAYFQWALDRGYSIRVHQPEYLDVCADAVARAACHTYRANSLDALDRLPVQTHEKLRVVGGAYLARSELAGRARRTYGAVREPLRRAGIRLPAWNWERSTSAPLGTMPTWDVLAAELSRARRGQFLYAHLLMPHYPYMYDGGCRPRPPSQWLTRGGAADGTLRGGILNSAEGRATRYRLYIEQISCTMRKIDQLLAAIPSDLRRDAIVIVQGDHGSRIGLVDPVATATPPGPSDYADHFSTLFAVRAPGLGATYDEQPAAVTCLLRGLVGSGFGEKFSADECTRGGLVHFWNGNTPEPRPLRPFWSGSLDVKNRTTP